MRWFLKGLFGSRRFRFARTGAVGRASWVALLMLALIESGGQTEAQDARGGRVGWGRLITPRSDWAIHDDQDPKLARFIRSQTSLNLDPVWYSVEAGKLDQLCAYPFLYVKDLSDIADQQEIKNLKEYLKRGGFICIDPCVAHFTPRSTQAYFERNTELFTQMFPGCEVRELPDDHALYHCYFNVTVNDITTADMLRLGAPMRPNIGIHGVFVEGRMIAAICEDGLECGWPQTPLRIPGCSKMIVNIYVYAMTQ